MGEAPNVYQDGDTLVIRASAIGLCVKGLVASKIGVDKANPSPALQRAFDAGKKYERDILNLVRKDHNLVPLVDDPQDVVVMRIRKGLEVRGHVDDHWEKNIVEVKLLNASDYKKYTKATDTQRTSLLPIYYKWQISVYMYATGLPALYVIAEKNKDGEWTGKYTSWYITNQPIPKTEIIQRAIFIKNAEELPACDLVNFPCMYSFLHTEQDEKGIKDYSEVDKDDEHLFFYYQSEIARIKRNTEALEEEKKRAYAGIKGLCEAYGSNRIKVGKRKIVMVKQTRRVVDWDKVSDEIKDALEECKVDGSTSEFPRFYGWSDNDED